MSNNLLSINGEQTISLFNSWLAWRNIVRSNNFENVQIHLSEEGYCEDCSNRGEINESTYGKIRCICNLKEHEKYLKKVIQSYESAWTPRNLDEIVLWGDNSVCTAIKYIKKSVAEWIKNPSSWLVFIGNNGVGKTMLMHIINTMLTPWSMYISMPDLESLYFQSMDDENGLNLLIDRISRHPILLLDDIGADYGSKFAKSATQKIIDFRYRVYSEFPTVVSSNLGAAQLLGYDRRIGDRILDASKNIILNFPMTSSFRTEGIKGIK